MPSQDEPPPLSPQTQPQSCTRREVYTSISVEGRTKQSLTVLIMCWAVRWLFSLIKIPFLGVVGFSGGMISKRTHLPMQET